MMNHVDALMEDGLVVGLRMEAVDVVIDWMRSFYQDFEIRESVEPFAIGMRLVLFQVHQKPNLSVLVPFL